MPRYRTTAPIETKSRRGRSVLSKLSGRFPLAEPNHTPVGRAHRSSRVAVEERRGQAHGGRTPSAAVDPAAGRSLIPVDPAVAQAQPSSSRRSPLQQRSTSSSLASVEFPPIGCGRTPLLPRSTFSPNLRNKHNKELLLKPKFVRSIYGDEISIKSQSRAKSASKAQAQL